jgi:PAS domain S-box-containing protein
VKVVAEDGTLLMMNSSGLEMIGAPAPEAAVGKSIYDLIAPEFRDQYREFNERICKGEKDALEFDIVGLRGRRRQMQTYAAPFRNSDGAIAQLGITQDITERKQAERADLLLAAIVESSDDAIVSKNLNGIITSWNKGAERLFGYTAEEVVGESITIIIPTDRLGEEPQILSRPGTPPPAPEFLSRGNTRPTALPSVRPDGHSCDRRDAAGCGAALPIPESATPLRSGLLPPVFVVRCGRKHPLLRGRPG